MTHDAIPQTERAILAGICSRRAHSENHAFEELQQLTQTAGATVVAFALQQRRAPHQRTFLGPGKVEDIHRTVHELDADLVIIDADISPSQQRHLEDILGVKVLDRTALILDIFAQHATSNEGRLQVELAQLTYMLPRLRGRGVELSRLGGGIGTRGPGETKLESDRRRIRARIHTLKRRLKDVERHRALTRRRRSDMFTCTLVGYTNAGKSSLMNALTHAGVHVEDALFATLDSTTRRLYLADVGEIVITDTVGFIKDLPHELVAAFHSTLTEVSMADLLLHLVDVSSEYWADHVLAVERTLEMIDAATVPRLLVLNKLDSLNEATIRRLREAYPSAICISALTGRGLDDLREHLGDVLRSRQATEQRNDLSKDYEV